ncbi:hypothetical protein [Bdellovibrio svalbardensis]|uniref:Porin family protein n=1 Tax=Bdellovibrio svalbardensis TaxID=2972972 RepID=A0ABT6DJQ5_9BACT|nr:hypothetical protein [Bdellovibrio svalbardensis]MDG0817103.1 porin family protein [Bdellovibrio svalbardensis]
MKISIVLAHIAFAIFYTSLASATSGETQTFALYGNGQASEGGDISWRGAQVGIHHDISEKASVGIIYYNEGHPENNHRDGYAAMGWRKQDFNDKLSFEVGVGPYYSMNTTNIDGEQFNNKHIGALAAAAVLYHFQGSNISLRAQYNHAEASGSFRTDTILIGVQADLGRATHSRNSNGSSYPTEISMWVGPSHTTQSDAGIPTGYQAEVRTQVSDNIAYSVDALSEGNSGLSNRKGVAGQVWYVSPSKNDWRVEAGAGPYLAHDNAEGRNDNQLLAIVTIRVNKKVTKRLKLGISFNRVISGNDRDQDMFLIGIESKL